MSAEASGSDSSASQGSGKKRKLTIKKASEKKTEAEAPVHTAFEVTIGEDDAASLEQSLGTTPFHFTASSSYLN